MIKFALLAALIVVLIMRSYILPRFHMKPIQQDAVDLERYCLIDVRDFVSYYRTPTDHTKNIPLSYLPRTMKEEAVCDKEIVVVGDDNKSIRMAARIINKHMKKSIYYFTV
ncbi:rhodanese-like domain-containing protein [Bacillus tianshenii]|nr:rhodanese-like domain-containing protein [Bacillus tianshenii]